MPARQTGKTAQTREMPSESSNSSSFWPSFWGGRRNGGRLSRANVHLPGDDGHMMDT